MSDDDVLQAAEMVFEMLASPNPDGVKRFTCFRFLEGWGDSYAEYPREFSAIVRAAREYGADWPSIASRVGMDEAEARRRWGRDEAEGRP
jgi:hypothetical protein